MGRKNECKPSNDCDDLDVAAAVSVDLDIYADVNLFECGSLVDIDAGLCLDIDASAGIG